MDLLEAAAALPAIRYRALRDALREAATGRYLRLSPEGFGRTAAHRFEVLVASNAPAAQAATFLSARADLIEAARRLGRSKGARRFARLKILSAATPGDLGA